MCVQNHFGDKDGCRFASKADFDPNCVEKIWDGDTEENKLFILKKSF